MRVARRPRPPPRCVRCSTPPRSPRAASRRPTAGGRHSRRLSTAWPSGCIPRASATPRRCCGRSPTGSTRRSPAGRPRAARSPRRVPCCAPSWRSARCSGSWARASLRRPPTRTQPSPWKKRRSVPRGGGARGGAWSASPSKADKEGPVAKVRRFPADAEGLMSVLIKRYANRKLYNTESSRYITLKGISDLLESGQEVKVIDNESGEDITSVTLSQILVDTERDGRSVPGNLLTGLLQRRGDALRRRVDDASEGLEEFKHNLRRLLPKQGRDWVAFAPPDFESIVQNAFERVAAMLDLPRRSDIERLSERLERVTRALEAMGADDGSDEKPAEPRALGGERKL